MSFIPRNHPQQVKSRGALDVVDDRRTPNALFSECCALAGVDGFDLDPCATQESARAPRFYSIADDGLSHSWFGRVWVNPPYSCLKSWVGKVIAERPRIVLACCLLPANRTEQVWWHDLIEAGIRSGEYRAFNLKGRRRFDRPGWTKPAKGDRPPFGLVVLVIPGTGAKPTTTKEEI